MSINDTQLAQLKTVLPYHIYQDVCDIKDGGKDDVMLYSVRFDVVGIGHHFANRAYDEIKPYLRPMNEDAHIKADGGPDGWLWCLQNHFDIFDLIGQGLALVKQ